MGGFRVSPSLKISHLQGSAPCHRLIERRAFFLSSVAQLTNEARTAARDKRFFVQRHLGR